MLVKTSAMKHRRSLSSSLELLETRIAPATISASVAGGVLKINALSPTGAATAHVNQVDADSFQVVDGSDILGVFDNVKSIVANLSNVNDTLDILFFPGPTFRGSIIVNSLAGQDSINFFSAGGGVNPSSMVGPVTVTSLGDSFTHLFAGANIRGPVKVSSPAGGVFLDSTVETLTTSQLSVVHLNSPAIVKGTLTVNMVPPAGGGGAINTAFQMDAGSSVRGALNYNSAGLGGDILTLAGQIMGKATLKLGDGFNGVTMSDTFRAHNTLTVKGGAQGDTVSLVGPNFFTTSIGGIMSLALGDGDNHVTVNQSRIAGALRVTAGTGFDTVDVSGAMIGGGVQTALGDATVGIAPLDYTGNVVKIFSGSIIGGPVQVTGGASGDFVSIDQNSTVLGVTRVALAAGANACQVIASSLDSGFTYTGLADNDTVNLFAATVRGPLSVSVGDGQNLVAIGLTNVYGNTVLKGGNVGNDEFRILTDTELNGTLTINAGNGSNAAFINTLSNVSAFTYNGGLNNDVVIISKIVSPGGAQDAGAYTRGKVKLGAGFDTADFSTSDFITFTIDGGADGDTVTQTAAAASAGLVLTNVETVITN
jgi:hypothetical protein